MLIAKWHIQNSNGAYCCGDISSLCISADKEVSIEW